MPDTPRDFDLVVYGATGYVGALTAAHLAAHAPPGTRIALAGRSREKLAAVRAGLPGRPEWPLLAADAADPASLAALATATRSVVTTVGPYARYGLPLVEACARAGTHYADLTGEVLFVREAIDRADAVAGTGARIVHACATTRSRQTWPSSCCTRAPLPTARAGDVRLIATARGGLSGGRSTDAPGRSTRCRDPAARRLAADPSR